jgi:hypothetical protein
MCHDSKTRVKYFDEKFRPSIMITRLVPILFEEMYLTRSPETASAIFFAANCPSGAASGSPPRVRILTGATPNSPSDQFEHASDGR